MLENKRYNLALLSLEELVEKKRISLSPERNRVRLFQEQYKTKLALSKLQIEGNTPPEEIPMIDAAILNVQSLSLINLFSLIGMPNSGKTSTTSYLATNPELYWVFDDAARRAYEQQEAGHLGWVVNKIFAKNYNGLEQANDTNVFAEIAMKQRVIENIDVSHVLDTLHIDGQVNAKIGRRNIIFERDFNDLPFVRASFLYGRVEEQILKTAEESFLKKLQLLKEYPRTILSCLVPPAVTLEREGDERKHRINEEGFLKVLYEQYLRFHSEMLNFENIYHEKPTFNYVAVNMSEGSIENNVRKIERFITEIPQVVGQQETFN